MAYIAKAVHLDGFTCIENPSLIAPNNSFYSMSFWWKNIKGGPPFQNGCFLVVDPDNFYWAILTNHGGIPSTPGLLFIDLAYDNSIITGFPEPLFINEGEWYHFLISVDANHPAGEKIFAIYVNDRDISDTYLSLQDNTSPFIMANNERPIRVLGDGFGDFCVGDVSDVWIAPGVSLLTGNEISESTRRIFTTLDGLPQDPIGFPSSAMLFSGDKNTFFQNKGTGGEFFLRGTLTDSGSSPSQHYHALAVHFNGQTWLQNNSLVGGGGDLFAFSGWVKLDTLSPNPTLFAVDPENSYTTNMNLYGQGGYGINLVALVEGEDGSLRVSDQPGTGPLTPNQWHHILFATRLNAHAGEWPVALYIDDVKVDPQTITQVGPFGLNLIFSGLPLHFGNDSSSAGIILDCADIWIITETLILDETGDIPLDTRRLFIDSWGRPVDPQVALDYYGPQSLLFSGDKDSFHINQGTWGPFSVVGALSDVAGPSGRAPISLADLTFPVGITRVPALDGIAYVVTDMTETSMVVTIEVDSVLGNAATFSGNPIQQDGAQNLAQLMLQISTGLVP